MKPVSLGFGMFGARALTRFWAGALERFLGRVGPPWTIRVGGVVPNRVIFPLAWGLFPRNHPRHGHS